MAALTGSALCSQLPRLSLMEPESEFRDIDNPPPEWERRGSRGSLRARSPEERGAAPTAPRHSLPVATREKPKRRVSDSFFRPSVMEPILGRAQYNQLRKKS